MDREEIIQLYRALDRDCAEFSVEIGHRGEGRYEFCEPFMPDELRAEEASNRLAGLKKRVEELPEPDPVFSLVRHHLEDFLDSLSFVLEERFRHPEKYYLGMDALIQMISRCSRQPDEERLAQILGRMESLDRRRAELEARLTGGERTPDELAGIAGSLCGTAAAVEADRGRLASYFPGFSQQQREQLDKAMERFSEENRKTADKLRAADEAAGEAGRDSGGLEADLSRTVRMDPEEYRRLLRDQLGVSLDELLSWYREEIEKTRAEALAIAAGLDIPEPAPAAMKEISGILSRYGAPCETAEEMIAKANRYLERTRALAHRVVRLPEDEQCVCVPLPECCRDTHPWGGYEGGDFRVRPFVGQMFLNQYNVPNITDGWIKMNALHEAYPGHHVQYVRAAVDETPETVKIGAKLVPLLEGTCIRTEKVYQSVYAEDPFFPLFVAYRRHHGSVRIRVDLELFLFGSPLEKAVQIYQEELGFDWITARRQVQAHLSSPGYFTCYYYGLKKISEWEKQYGYTEDEFTELLFSAGYISIDRFGEYLALTPEERERYAHDFGG